MYVTDPRDDIYGVRVAYVIRCVGLENKSPLKNPSYLLDSWISYLAWKLSESNYQVSSSKPASAGWALTSEELLNVAGLHKVIQVSKNHHTGSVKAVTGAWNPEYPVQFKKNQVGRGNPVWVIYIIH